MVRNLSKRVEVVTPVFRRLNREKLWEFLEICLRDERQAWALQNDGAYARVQSEDAGSGTHLTMMNLKRARAV